MKKSNFYACLAALALICGSFGARADSDGWVMFTMTNQAGSVPIVRVNELGKIHQQPHSSTPGDFLFTNWAHGLVGYDRTFKLACSFEVYEDGGTGTVVACTQAFNTLASITQLVGFGEFVLGYDGGNLGQIVKYYVNPAFITPLAMTTQTFGLSVWTHIFATKNYIFFYNKSSGIYAVGTISDAGQFVQYTNGTMTTGYSLFAISGDTLVGYNKASGKYEVDAINFQSGTGAFSVALAKQSSGTFDKGYSTVATLGNSLVWHSGGSGATLVGYLGRTPGAVGKWVQTSKAVVGAGSAIEVAAGNSLLFYNKTTGQLLADTISPAGALIETDRANIGAGYIQAGVTTR